VSPILWTSTSLSNIRCTHVDFHAAMPSAAKNSSAFAVGSRNALGRTGQPGLVRALGPAAASSIVLGTMIGTGIFLKPSEVAVDAGSAGWALAAWVVGAFVSLLGALCYVELGSSIPEAGGEYAYLREGMGEAWGFLFGWTHSMVARPASVAAIAAGFLRFCGFLRPGSRDGTSRLRRKFRSSARTGRNRSARLAWFAGGLIPFWARDASIGFKTINAMSETAAENPLFGTPCDNAVA
jgi:amino acid transporter